MRLDEMKTVNHDTAEKLERIAMDAVYSLEKRGGIEGRGGDSVDFLEVSVYSIQRILEQAYLLGLKDGRATK